MKIFHQLRLFAETTSEIPLIHDSLPELSRRQQRSLPSFYSTSSTQQQNYLTALMGTRKPDDSVDRTYGPRKTTPKHPRPQIAIDTSSEEFPDLPSRTSSSNKTQPKLNQSYSTITSDQSDIITKLQSQIQELTTVQQNTQRQLEQQQLVLVKLQDQMNTHLQQQTVLLNRLLDNQTQSSISDTPPPSPPLLNMNPILISQDML